MNTIIQLFKYPGYWMAPPCRLVVLRRARLERHSTRLAEPSRVPLAYSEGTRRVESSRVPSESVPSESYSPRRAECLPSGRAFRVILAEPSACALLSSLRTCYVKTFSDIHIGYIVLFSFSNETNRFCLVWYCFAQDCLVI